MKGEALSWALRWLQGTKGIAAFDSFETVVVHDLRNSRRLMNYQSLSMAFVSVLAISIRGASAADATPAEAADRQFLANLERQEEVQRPTVPAVEVVKPAPVAEGPAVKEARTVKKDTTATAKVTTTGKKPAFRVSQVQVKRDEVSAQTTPVQVKRDEAPVRTATVEIRRATPVTTTTTVVTTSRRDHHDNDDDGDDDRGNHDRRNGFFNRLFSGER